MTKTTCKRCGKCCTQYPCNLLPQDIPRIAQYLGITDQEVIDQYLIIDYYATQFPEDMYFLVPKRENDHPNVRFASFGWAFQRISCVFFLPPRKVSTACRIHEVKPFGGQHMECWNKKHIGKDFFGYAWLGNLGQKYLKMGGLQ